MNASAPHDAIPGPSPVATRRASRIRPLLRGAQAAVASVVLLATVDAKAVAADPGFADLSLEELADIRITSVSKRSEPLAKAPSSIFVITNEDIRRSGATTLPEASASRRTCRSRAIDARNYAVTARGFNNALANKLLVMIDGRTVYTPLFSGVFWDVQDVMLEDIDRIEVISGPGGTLWGANAVNGVINVITRAARRHAGPPRRGRHGNRDTRARCGMARLPVATAITACTPRQRAPKTSRMRRASRCEPAGSVRRPASEATGPALLRR